MGYRGRQRGDIVSEALSFSDTYDFECNVVIMIDCHEHCTSSVGKCVYVHNVMKTTYAMQRSLCQDGMPP